MKPRVRPLELPSAMPEMELDAHLHALASCNRPVGKTVCFLGGGSYDHFIPAVVDEIASRAYGNNVDGQKLPMMASSS